MLTESEIKAYTVDIPNDIQAAQRASGSLERVVSLHDVTDEGKYVVRLRCKDCGHELNSTSEMTGTQINANWATLAIGSALVSGRCPKGCRSTFSDCNINTEMVITPVEANGQAHAPVKNQK